MSAPRDTGATHQEWYRNKFVLLIAGSIGISLVLVTVAVSVYNSNGAAQLDLSRPGFSSVRDKIIKEDKDRAAYPSSGTFDQKAFDDFDLMYQKYSDAVKAINGYDSAAVNNDAINIVPTEQTATP